MQLTKLQSDILYLNTIFDIAKKSDYFWTRVLQWNHRKHFYKWHTTLLLH